MDVRKVVVVLNKKVIIENMAYVIQNCGILIVL